MQKFLTLGALATVLGGLAFAENFNGRLLDATCIDQSKSRSCDPTATTAVFAIVVNGKALRLDDEGNGKAVKALKNRADRQGDPNAVSPAVLAKITGTMEGDVIRVDAIQLQ